MSICVPTLETERLILRGWRARDYEPLADFLADDPGAVFVGGPLDRNEAWRGLALRIGHWHLRGHGPFAIEEKSSGHWLGWCGLWSPQDFPEIELGYAVRTSHHGRGIATEAARCVKCHAFETVGLKTLVSYIRSDNLPSQKLARRLGAALDGTTFTFRNRQQADVWRYPAPPARH